MKAGIPGQDADSHATLIDGPVSHALPDTFPPGRAALVVAHPGHELRVHGWLELARPRVFVLTDGSGRTAASRVPSTTAVLEGAGATSGRIFGRFTDAAFYEAVLKQDFPLFTALTAELAGALVEDQIDCVAGDAAEGYNPTHDVCRLVIDAATRIASRIRNTPIANLEFALVGRPDAAVEGPAGAICLELEPAALQRKLRAARGYAEIAGEVAAALNAWGAEAFGRECFRSVADEDPAREPEDPPYYERFGEERVGAGSYERVIRYREHVRPLAESLRRYADDTR